MFPFYQQHRTLEFYHETNGWYTIIDFWEWQDSTGIHKEYLSGGFFYTFSDSEKWYSILCLSYIVSLKCIAIFGYPRYTSLDHREVAITPNCFPFISQNGFGEIKNEGFFGTKVHNLVIFEACIYQYIISITRTSSCILSPEWTFSNWS